MNSLIIGPSVNRNDGLTAAGHKNLIGFLFAYAAALILIKRSDSITSPESGIGKQVGIGVGLAVKVVAIIGVNIGDKNRISKIRIYLETCYGTARRSIPIYRCVITAVTARQNYTRLAAGLSDSDIKYRFVISGR